MVRWGGLMVGWGGVGTWPLDLGASPRRRGLADAGSAPDAHGRHRLAQTAEDLDAPDRSVSYARDSPVFMRLLWIFCHRSHGILRSWLPPLFPTSIGSISKP